MNLELKDQLFLIGGATSGFGKAVTEALIRESAKVIVVARGKEKLQEQYANKPLVEIVEGDITQHATIEQLKKVVADRQLHGILVNAGGPPAKTVLETTLEDWDDAYQKILRWKVELTQAFVPSMIKAGYGRLVYVESSSVKQPIENLVLLGPGSHNTPAIDRLYVKKSEQTGLPFDDVKKNAIQQIPVGALGEADDFASLAVWLLSKSSRYITGQTILVDGGMVKGIF